MYLKQSCESSILLKSKAKPESLFISRTSHHHGILRFSFLGHFPWSPDPGALLQYLQHRLLLLRFPGWHVDLDYLVLHCGALVPHRPNPPLRLPRPPPRHRSRLGPAVMADSRYYGPHCNRAIFHHHRHRRVGSAGLLSHCFAGGRYLGSDRSGFPFGAVCPGVYPCASEASGGEEAELSNQ